MAALTLDGSHGEGGGQILRTCLSLSALTGRAFRLVNIRAHRRTPGLMPQHLSAVRAAAVITGAAVSGDELGSLELHFVPACPPMPGTYVFDVAQIAERGSAGSTTLLLQALLVPLALASGPSTLVLRGGTHVELSPSFDDVVNVYLPMLRRMGIEAEAELDQWGWYPIGRGEVRCSIAGKAIPKPLELLSRGALQRLTGRAVAANLASHIPRRMADRARSTLRDLSFPVDIKAERVRAAGSGTGIFLFAEYEELPASFSAYGQLGKASEDVADEAVAAFREHHASGAVVERHLADQLLLPLALASGVSSFTTAQATGHLLTNAWTVGQFGVADISIGQETSCFVRLEPRS
jgi:RNA 3'-terminal phosphate cyclase (ATP)